MRVTRRLIKTLLIISYNNKRNFLDNFSIHLGSNKNVRKNQNHRLGFKLSWWGMSVQKLIWFRLLHDSVILNWCIYSLAWYLYFGLELSWSTFMRHFTSRNPFFNKLEVINDWDTIQYISKGQLRSIVSLNSNTYIDFRS